MGLSTTVWVLKWLFISHTWLWKMSSYWWKAESTQRIQIRNSLSSQVFHAELALLVVSQSLMYFLNMVRMVMFRLSCSKGSVVPTSASRKITDEDDSWHQLEGSITATKQWQDKNELWSISVARTHTGEHKGPYYYATRLNVLSKWSGNSYLMLSGRPSLLLLW